MNTALFRHTPSVAVLDSRGLTVRAIAYHRHPDSLDVTDERITRHQYDARGALVQSVDPCLHEAGLANFTYFTDLGGNVLRSQGVDNGISVTLSDAAGRPFLAVSNIRTADDGTDDRSLAVTRTWQYEDASLPGRPLSVTERVSNEAARITERFVWVGNSAEEKALNLAGQCASHYDTAGLTQTDGVALTGVPLSVTRRLLKDADNPDAVADWKGTDASVWNDLLDAETYTTLSTADASGVMLTTTDAKGNLQRMAYDVAGLLSGSWLMLKGGKEQTVVKSLTYSAAGQKVREEHGNGVVTTYTYEAETQRLTGIKTERPAGHASGAKVLQDLRYQYDPVGNVLKITNDAEEASFWRNQKVVPENTYVYDSLYQLVSATGREMTNAGQQGSNLPAASVPLPTDSSAFTNYTRTYTYDKAGNLTQIRHSAPATNNSYTTNITVSDKSNRGVLSTLTENPSDVDALFTAGGLQMQLQPGQSLAWTPRNELLKVSPVVRDGSPDDRESYRYDGGSQRILKVSLQKTGNSTQTQRVLYLPGLELRSTKAGGTETESLQVITVGEAGRAQVRVLRWTGGKPDAISNDQVRYRYDNLTCSSLELDGDGNVISMEEYYPYGGTAVWTARSVVESDYRTVRYSGKERDATGLYYYGYRYYQPWAGRWLSADPVGTVDGPNLFRMVGSNPLTFVDSDGLSRTRAINDYAEFISAAENAVYSIHTYLDVLQNPTRRRVALLRSVAGKSLVYGGKVAGAVAGAAAGAAIGASLPFSLPVVGAVAITTVAVGAAVGSISGGITNKLIVKHGINAVFNKNKFNSTRVQTSKLNTSLRQAGGSFLVNTVQDQLDWKEQAKNYGSKYVANGLSEYIGYKLPVKDFLDLGLELSEMGGINLGKRKKINDVLSTITNTLTDETHKKVLDLFDEKNVTSVQKTGTLYLGVILRQKVEKNTLSEARNNLLKRIDDVRRMLRHPDIYKNTYDRSLVAFEGAHPRGGPVSRRHSV